MRILYDGQIYAYQVAGGINRYFANIIKRLPTHFQPILTVPYRKNRLHYPTHSNLRLKQYPDFRPHRVSSYLRSRYFRWISDRIPFDIVHPTYYEQFGDRPFSKVQQPLVITVYDMIHELFGEALEAHGGTQRLKREAILAAAAILCISESTKRDLLKYYPDIEDRVSVTYLASDFGPHLITESVKLPDRPYFLYVGSRTKAYKNFDSLLRAVSKAISIHPDLALAVVGAPFDLSELALIEDLRLKSHLYHYQYVSDNRLARLYQSSVAFVYPSLYEGFGIPPLEAMACGTPVVAANSSSIPEVVGDAGILFDPHAISDLADILLDLIDHPAKRDHLIKQGHHQHQKFSWDKTTAQTVQIYRSLL